MTQRDAERSASDEADGRGPGNLPVAPPATRPRRRRWYQFSLWTLFALTLLAAVVLMGWRWTVAPYLAQADTMALVERLGGSYRSEPAPKWMSRLAGQELGDATLVNLADCDQPDEYIAEVARLPRLEILVVGGQAFGDDEVAQLSGTKSLRWLILDSTSVSADALAEVQDANRELQVYRSERRTIAAIRAAGGGLSSKINDKYRDLRDIVGKDTFDEPYFLEAYQSVDPRLVSRLTSLTNAFLLGPITDAEIAEIAKTPNLESLSFHSPQMADAGVEHLSCMRQLRHLGLVGSSITDLSLARLANNKELKGLYLGSTRTTDAGLAHLDDLRNMESLALETTLISDEGLAHLGAMNGLRRLRVPRTRVGDAGLAHLANHTAMEHLSISETQVTDAGLKAIAGMTKLKELDIGQTSISDQGLGHLAGLHDLEHRWMRDTKVTDRGLVHLAGMAKLGRRHLEGTQITDAAVDQLAKLASLKELDVRDTRITDEGLAKLKSALPGCQISSGVRKPRKP